MDQLPWSATLPISPQLRSQWQKYIDQGDIINLVNLFPTIWSCLKLSTNWIVEKQPASKTKATKDIRSHFATVVKLVNNITPPQCWDEKLFDI